MDLWFSLEIGFNWFFKKIGSNWFSKVEWFSRIFDFKLWFFVWFGFAYINIYATSKVGVGKMGKYFENTF